MDNGEWIMGNREWIMDNGTKILHFVQNDRVGERKIKNRFRRLYENSPHL